MQAKWRLCILLGYAVFLVWQFTDVFASSEGLGDLLFVIVYLLAALMPVAILCLTPFHEPALGFAAFFLALFGVWAYKANDGDPIGLLIIVFYQFSLVGIAFVVIAIGARIMERKR